MATIRVRANKYGAKRTECEGFWFDSKREAARYAQLRLLECAGEIKELELQPKFPIYICRSRNGELTKVCDYIADFRYREGPRGILVVEDVKGVRTPTYRLKKKMAEAQYDIQIREV